MRIVVCRTARRFAVVTVGVALLLSACGSSSRTGSGGVTSTSSGAGSPTSTTDTTATSSPTTVGAVPASAVMLEASGRTIVALDATGRPVKTLVTVFAGREVVNAHLMADHRTIWYATRGNGADCSEVVKLDLRSNARTVVAFASDFTLSPDGSRLLLVWTAAASTTKSCAEHAQLTFTTRNAIVVRDLPTGAQSSLSSTAYPSAGTGGPSGPIWMSPDGDRLVDAICTNDPCAMREFAVPAPLGGAITRAGAGPACGCSTLVTGTDGVYGVDQGSYPNPQYRIRRYDAASVSGTGQVLATPNGISVGPLLAPTSAGLFVLGFPTGATVASLYRVTGGSLQFVSRLAAAANAPAGLFPIPPAAAG